MANVVTVKIRVVLKEDSPDPVAIGWDLHDAIQSRIFGDDVFGADVAVDTWSMKLHHGETK